MEEIIMPTLSTIQKREKLNDVFIDDEIGPGGAHHQYSIIDTEWNKEHGGQEVYATIEFQKGPRKDPASQHGVIDTDLLEIVRHRLQCFQRGDFATRENACALTHIEEALMWMNRRVEDRIERGVLGTYGK
jgi:hypothetical protein